MAVLRFESIGSLMIQSILRTSIQKMHGQGYAALVWLSLNEEWVKPSPKKCAITF